jgi:TolA-binding protein
MHVRRAFVLAIVALALVVVGCKSGPSQQQMFENAKKFQEQGDFQSAVDTYQQIVKRYPKSPEAPQCQFMVGYLYANHLKNIDMAKDAYQTFIRNYPENDLVKDAQWELDHLGQDVNNIEELNRVLTNRGDTTETVTDSLH